MAARQYVRFYLRGKLTRGVPVLLHKEDVECVDLILRYRGEAGVPDDNPCVFGIPGKDSNNHLLANPLICEFSHECGAANPQRLGCTLLRKHLATGATLYKLNELEIDGHVYRSPTQNSQEALQVAHSNKGYRTHVPSARKS